jgi:NAD(P)-dependent dehydrogenase (short-subunit alcohol dehydrogenase family)
MNADRRTTVTEPDAGKVVVVTGAGAGLGRAIATAFGRRHARVGLISRDRGRLELARQEIEALGGQALVLPADVADPDEVEAAAGQAEQTFGPIDVWVNNAMATVFGPVRLTTAAEFRRVTEVTYLGFVHGTLAALHRMLPRDRGTIVQVGSALSYRSIPLQAAYCGAKHAMIGFTDSLRSELIHDGSHVRITVVHVPASNTPQFTWSRSRMPRKAQPLPPIFQPEVGAEAVWRAAEGTEREVFVGWPTVQAIWGHRFIPGLLDRYLAGQGWDGQMYDGLEDASRPHNLEVPVPGSYGARGPFDDRAKPNAPPTWLTTHAGAMSAAGIALLGLILAAARRRSTGSRSGSR